MEQKDQIRTNEIKDMTETQRQLFYIEKAAMYVQGLKEELGRRPTCCVTTFGCQMNTEHEIEKPLKRGFFV